MSLTSSLTDDCCQLFSVILFVLVPIFFNCSAIYANLPCDSSTRCTESFRFWFQFLFVCFSSLSLFRNSLALGNFVWQTTHGMPGQMLSNCNSQHATGNCTSKKCEYFWDSSQKLWLDCSYTYVQCYVQLVHSDFDALSSTTTRHTHHLRSRFVMQQRDNSNGLDQRSDQQLASAPKIYIFEHLFTSAFLRLFYIGVTWLLFMATTTHL